MLAMGMTAAVGERPCDQRHRRWVPAAEAGLPSRRSGPWSTFRDHGDGLDKSRQVDWPLLLVNIMGLDSAF